MRSWWLELLMVVRRPTTWFAWALLVLPPTVLRRADLTGVITIPQEPAAFFLGAAPLPLALAALLIGAPLLAARHRRHLDTVWSRGLSSYRLAMQTLSAGAIAGVAGLAVALGTFLAAAQVAPTQFGETAGAALVVCLPALMLYLALSALLGLILGEILAAAVIVAVVALSAIVLPQSALFPWTVLGGGTFREPTLGFGPDTDLVLARGGMHLAVAIALVGVGSWLLGVVDRRARASRWHNLVLVAALLVALPPSVSYAATTHAGATIPSWPVVDVGASVRTRAVDVDLDCEAGRLAGRSTLDVIEATGPLIVGLNPGLRVHSVEPTMLAWTQDASGAVFFQQIAAPTQIAIVYEGALVLHRDDYQPAHPGVGMTRAIALPIRAYLAPELCFLLEGGDWYPRAIGRGDGSDGAVIPELRYRIRGAAQVVHPVTGSPAGTLASPPACSIVAIGAATNVGAHTSPDPLADVQWDRLRADLRGLHMHDDARATYLPLIGETITSDTGVCTPSRGLPATIAPYSARLMANNAAALAMRRHVVLEPRAGVQIARGSAQEEGPRALPALLPAYLRALQDTIADTLEPDLPQLIALRREALTSVPAEGRLLLRGVLPGRALYEAVLGVHSYRELSGDTDLARLLDALAAAAPEALPSRATLQRVVASLPELQRTALAPLVALQ